MVLTLMVQKEWALFLVVVPRKPVAYNDGLLWLNLGLLWCIVAYDFGQLGFPGRSKAGAGS